MPWTDRLREVLRQKAQAFFPLEDAVLAGDDPEAIHDMRVASRRLQEVLRLVFSEDPRLKGLTRDIRLARRAQSPVRDLDVMAGYLLDAAKGASGDAQDALRFSQQTLAARRRRRHRKMVKTLQALDLKGLRTGLEGLISLWMRGRSGPTIARAEVQRRAQSQIAARADAFREAVSTARGSLKPEDLHGARVAGKRLRYILETSDELQIGSFKRRIARMRAIQQALGGWHDLEVLEETVTRLFANREVFRDRLPLVRAGCDLIAAWRAQKEARLREFLELTGEKAVSLSRGASGPSRRGKR
jgi:CHAD domain-containing protein